VRSINQSVNQRISQLFPCKRIEKTRGKDVLTNKPNEGRRNHPR